MTLAFAGLAAGAIHVLSGPDHLAAIAPIAVADPARSWRSGTRWGIGHTAGVLGVGVLALLSRRAVPIEMLSLHGELAAGLALVVIGSWGAWRALWRFEQVDRLVHGHRHGSAHAALAVGTVHGLAGSSHLLGILPALAIPSDYAAGVYLLCFGVGSIASMGAFASFIGWIASRPRVDTAVAKRTLLCLFSVVAIVIGGYWLLTNLPVAFSSSAVALETPGANGREV